MCSFEQNVSLEGYMRARWFSACRRTANEVSTRKTLASYPEALSARRSIGFEPRHMKHMRLVKCK